MASRVDDTYMKRSKVILLYVLALMLALVTVLGAFLGGMALTHALPHTRAILFCWALNILLIALMLTSGIGAALFLKKKRAMRVADGHQYLDEKRNTIKQDLERATRHLQRSALCCRLYIVLVTLLPHAAVFFMGVAVKNYIPFLLIDIWAVLGIYSRFGRALGSRPKLDKNECLAKDKYPLVYAVAERAKKAAGLSGEVYLVASLSHDASIARFGKNHVILLGSSLLGSESEEELYNILLHEFAHMTENYTPKAIDPLFGRFMADEEGGTISRYAEVLLLLPTALYNWEYALYLFLASETIEAKADAIVKEKGNGIAFANALAKCVLHSHFERLSENWLAPLYAPEEMRRDYATYSFNGFCRALEEKGGAWLEALEHEIQSKSASHPIFRTRRDAVGVTKEQVKPILPAKDTPFAKECAAIMAYVDANLYKDNKDAYAEGRKVNYLRPLAIVNAWKEEGKPLSADDSIPVVQALCNLNRFDEAEALCEEMIAAVKNPSSTAYHRFVKARLLMDRDDDSAIAQMYEVIELNSNFLQEGLDAIGAYCCRRGLQKELDEYRAKAAGLLQKGIDEHDPAGILTHRDNLVKDDMDKNKLDAHIAFMVSVGEGKLVGLYLVKKLITATFSSSVFVVELAPDTDGETVDRVMDKIFRHLDTSDGDEQYSLFLMNDYYRKVVKKVPDSCVWKKA